MKLGLNVGSGQRRFKTTHNEVRWINVDKISSPPDRVPDLMCDGAHLPFDDQTVDYFVLHHVIEHFNCGEAADLVREAHRLLKKGGSLLVFVPNMRTLCAHWLGGEMDTQLFLTSVYGAYIPGEIESIHKWGFDAEHLYQFISAHGKWEAHWFDWREISGADIANSWWILGMEYVRT